MTGHEIAAAINEEALRTRARLYWHIRELVGLGVRADVAQGPGDAPTRAVINGALEDIMIGLGCRP